MNLNNYKKLYFIGIAGAGMSAIAQYLHWKGFEIAGSDREFAGDRANHIQAILQQTGIKCYAQNGEALTDHFDAVVVSTAVEQNNIEYSKALQLQLPIIHRADMLKHIAESSKTIAVSGTSGKSTTVAMLYHLMSDLGFSPSLITGAGLNMLKQEGKLGNAAVGNSKWLIIEADESDGTLEKYKAEIGVILNIDKDHKTLDELHDIFKTFADNCKDVIVNRDSEATKKYSKNSYFDFGTQPCNGLYGSNFRQDGYNIKFNIQEVEFEIPVIGKHNYENALAAVSVIYFIGGCIVDSALSLKSFDGLDRRHEVLGSKNGITVIDDYAHNPVKLAASIVACQQLGKRVIAWFQPHGFGPLRFLKNDFIAEVSAILRENDELWVSDVFYSGGTVTKDITSAVISDGIAANGKKSFYVPNRDEFIGHIKPQLSAGDIILITGARDPSLSAFAHSIVEAI